MTVIFNQSLFGQKFFNNIEQVLYILCYFCVVIFLVHGWDIFNGGFNDSIKLFDFIYFLQ